MDSMTSAAGHTAISKSPNHSKPKAHCFINRVGIWIAAFVLLILSRPCEAQIDVYGFLADINSNPGRVSMFDTQTNSIIGASITVGNLPQGVTIAPDGKYAYIANEGTNAISVLDVATRNVVGTVPVGSGPSAVAVSADGKFAYATNSNSNTVSVIQTATNQVVGLAIPVGAEPLGIAVSPDGKFLYTSNFGSSSVSIVNTATNTVVNTISVNPAPFGVAVTPNGQYVYVTNGSNGSSNTVTVINTTTLATTTIVVGGAPLSVAITPDGKFAYVTSQSGYVSVVDTATQQVVATIPIPNGAIGVAITPNGQFAYVTDGGGVSIVATATNTVVGSFPFSGNADVNGSILGPNIIVAQGGPLLVGSDAALSPLGFGQFVDFNGGTLKLTGNMTTSRTISLLAQGGTIDTNHFNAAFSGDIINSGSLTKTGLGTLTLSGNNTYSGGTNFNGGVLAVSSDGNLGTGPLSFDGGTLQALATGGGITSTKAITLNGGGGTFLADTGTTSTLNGAMGGVGSFTKDGLGTLTLSGANAYSGGTTISAGVLIVSADNNLGVPSGGLTFNGGTLQFGSAFNLGNTRTITLNGSGGTFDTNGFNTSISQGITGIGGLTKTGAGTLTLSGTNSYSGGTVLNAGILVVNNAQALGLGNVTVNAGILEADPQPINVKRNYTQNAGGTLLLQVAGAGSGQYDFLNVSGNANLGGTLQLTNLGYKPKAGDQLTLVTVGGSVTSRFARWVDPFTTGPGINTIDLIYSKNSVTLAFLNLTTPVPPVGPNPPPVVITTVDFASFAQTPNQRAAANLLDDLQLDPRASNLMSFLNKEPFGNLPGDFEKISPESLTAFYEISFSGANIQRLNLENRLEDIRNGSGGASVTGATVYLQDKADGKSSKNPPMLPPVREKRWDFWSASFGDFVHVDSDFNAHGYKFTTGGIDLGIDYRLTDHLAFGLMGSYAHTWSDLQAGSIDVDSGRGGLYATYFNRCFYLNGGIYGAYNSYDSSRRGLQGHANGNSDGAEFSTFVSGGYDFHFGHLTIGPIASLQYTNVYVDGFREKGSLAPLSIHSDSEESLRSDVGFRASYQWRIGSVDVEPFLKATWEHEFKYSTLPITAGFADISGPSATFLGPAEGHDSAVVDAGISVSWTPRISTYVSYNGLLGRDRYDSNGVSGGIRISF